MSDEWMNGRMNELSESYRSSSNMIYCDMLKELYSKPQRMDALLNSSVLKGRSFWEVAAERVGVILEKDKDSIAFFFF